MSYANKIRANMVIDAMCPWLPSHPPPYPKVAEINVLNNLKDYDNCLNLYL